MEVTMRAGIPAVMGLAVVAATGGWLWGNGQEVSGPPPPAPLQEVRESPPDAVRHLTILADRDRGPVWLLTGFLHSQCDSGGDKVVPDHLIRRVKTQYWRSSGVGRDPSSGWRQATLHLVDDLRIPFCDCLSDEYRETQPDPNQLRPWEDFDAYYKFVYDHITRLKREGHNIRYWEIWNEPDSPTFWHGTREQFFETFKVAHDAIRAADPEGWVGGPSFTRADWGEGVAAHFRPFLRYCQQHDVQLDFLVWHELGTQPELIPHHAAELRNLVEEEFADLGIKEYHINEWGNDWSGPGTQVAYFYYLDQAGITRAAKAVWGPWYLDGILADATTPKTAYWAWVAYADGVGKRLITRTDDQRLVALASRDEQGTVRVVIGRSENPWVAQPPVKAKVMFRGLSFPGQKAQVDILHLPAVGGRGPEDRPFAEEELAEHTYTQEISLADGRASLTLPSVKENEVYSLTLRPLD